MATSLETLCINTLRGLAIDIVQKANSGHPGLPLGAAPMAFTLWTKHLRHNPANPNWFNRDRFILSAGHGSALLYALLYLTGYQLSLEELQNFRQWGSKTPGHPENGLTPGVEVATGPLGQGLAMAVGMAIAERYLAGLLNRLGPEVEDQIFHQVVDHHTYVIVSDGDLMEGVAQEAVSLAGHLGLGKLIVLYDDNQITIDGGTETSFTEDTACKFEAMGWHVQRVDGLDPDAVNQTVENAKNMQSRPSLLICRTVIGYGSPGKAGSAKSHGAPLGVDEVKLTKKALGLPEEESFWVPDDVLNFFRYAREKGMQYEKEWQKEVDTFLERFSEERTLINQMVNPVPPKGWQAHLPTFAESMATRQASFKVMQRLKASFQTLIGGCADLAESVFATFEGEPYFSYQSPTGRNIAFGVREHAMAAIVNGITLHGGARGFGGTFLIFSDYCRPSLRLAALMHCPSIFVFSHDSIGLGEDGPTHQPVEHLMSLRAIPNFNVFRPADANETTVGWKVALESSKTPTALILTRQSLPILTPTNIQDHPAEKGAYILQEAATGQPRVILLATGSEVGLACQAKEMLEAEGISIRVVSMPSWFLFEKQPETYREKVLPKEITTISIEAAVSLGWAKYAQVHVSLDRFGASAPGPVLMKEFGFTAANLAQVVRTFVRS